MDVIIDSIPAILIVYIISQVDFIFIFELNELNNNKNLGQET